ncbi:MAG: phytoene/squalene synthase family protein [Pseudomonadota bacterium]
MESVEQHSREMIQKGSRSFSAAAALFDRSMRADVEMLYAWCRHCDDIIDGQILGFRQEHSRRLSEASPSERLASLKSQTIAAHGGEPQVDPVFQAFQNVVQTHQMPLAYPLDLLVGFEMDVNMRHYETLNDTMEYCYHVAGVVGVMMAYIMGVRDEATLQRACDLGLAFQLTNIARDIVEDAENDRVYLPAEWLDEQDLKKTDLHRAENRPRIFLIAQKLLIEADRYYASASIGVGALDFRPAWAISAAADVYRAIGGKIIDRGAEAWDTRTSTNRRRKLQAVAFGLYRACQLRIFKPDPNANPRRELWTKAL